MIAHHLFHTHVRAAAALKMAGIAAVWGLLCMASLQNWLTYRPVRLTLHDAMAMAAGVAFLFIPGALLLYRRECLRSGYREEGGLLRRLPGRAVAIPMLYWIGGAFVSVGLYFAVDGVFDLL